MARPQRPSWSWRDHPAPATLAWPAWLATLPPDAAPRLRALHDPLTNLAMAVFDGRAAWGDLGFVLGRHAEALRAAGLAATPGALTARALLDDGLPPAAAARWLGVRAPQLAGRADVEEPIVVLEAPALGVRAWFALATDHVPALVAAPAPAIVDGPFPRATLRPR